MEFRQELIGLFPDYIEMLQYLVVIDSGRVPPGVIARIFLSLGVCAHCGPDLWEPGRRPCGHFRKQNMGRAPVRGRIDKVDLVDTPAVFAPQQMEGRFRKGRAVAKDECSHLNSVSHFILE